MKAIKRLFLVVLDSFGIGALPDAADFSDEGSNTYRACRTSPHLNIPTLRSLGLDNIAMTDGRPVKTPLAAYGALAERSRGKDTTVGHWEIAGLISPRPLPTYPNGFPDEVMAEFSRLTGRGWIPEANRPYSGTEVIRDFGERHLKTGEYIVYTSADSVFQVAAHEDKVPLDELYDACRTARKLLQGEHAVGRVIARPFTGTAPDFVRTKNRHDYSLEPPGTTMLDLLSEAGADVISVGKISDIFCGRGITQAFPTGGNADGMRIMAEQQKHDFTGLCFINLVDFDMLYGHRNDPDGYARALSEFDVFLSSFIKGMRSDDALFITADHGCDPVTPSTDHSREYVPFLGLGDGIIPADIGIRTTFADIAETVCEMFGINGTGAGTSFLSLINRA